MPVRFSRPGIFLFRCRLAPSPATTYTSRVAAKPNIFAIVGSDDGRVKEETLRLHRELTGGNDDGFTHEMIEGTADNSEGAFQICRSVVEALQTSDKNGVATPVNWKPGESVIVPPPQTAAAAEERMKAGYDTTDWYFSKKSI